MGNSTNGGTSIRTYESLRRELASSPKTWLVTGVAGFIGSNIMEQLLGIGQNVVGLDNFSTGYQTNIDDALEIVGEARDQFRLIVGDIRDPKACAEACKGVDYVLHHAALGSVPRSIDDPALSNQVNVDGTLNVFAAARDAKVRRVVYASSSAVYGDTVKLPQAEETIGRPLSPYAATKGANELYAAAFQLSYGLQLIGLRYFNVFGRRQDPNGAYAAVIPRWVASQLDGEVCRIFGRGEHTRDYVFVKDVVQANVLAACGDEAATNQVYNVGRGESTSLMELFGLVQDALVAFDPSVVALPPSHEPERLGDIPRSVADISKARRMLGFAPTYEIAAGLSEALEWYARSSSAAG